MAATSDEEPKVEPPEHLKCPISLQIMRDPVIASDEQTCKRAIFLSADAPQPCTLL